MSYSNNECTSRLNLSAQSLVNMATTSSILHKSELIIERYTTTLEQMSQNTHYYYVLKTVCRVSIKRKSLKANHAETKAASEALRSGLVWIINNEVHISNKNNKAIAIVNGQWSFITDGNGVKPDQPRGPSDQESPAGTDGQLLIHRNQSDEDQHWAQISS